MQDYASMKEKNLLENVLRLEKDLISNVLLNAETAFVSERQFRAFKKGILDTFHRVHKIKVKSLFECTGTKELEADLIVRCQQEPFFITSPNVSASTTVLQALPVKGNPNTGVEHEFKSELNQSDADFTLVREMLGF